MSRLPQSELGFQHVWRPQPDPAEARTLLLLHGTGGDENDLVPLGRALDPQANLLSPRGRVSENGMPRFFRRFAEGVLDVEDLKARAVELAGFIERARVAYGFDPERVVAFGFSNGANVAQGILFERPLALAGAALARPMLVYEPAPGRTLEGKRALVLAGERDPFTTPAQAQRLADVLLERGATAELNVERAGHELTPRDVERARAWLAG